MRRVLPERLTEVAVLFLKLGFIGFGGPAAHIAMMHDEVVTRRKWLHDQEFLDLVGATNLIPGPNSTEMAIHIGFQRAKWMGLVTGGACFIVPPMCMVLMLAALYVHFGSMVQARWLLYGVKPVVISIILQALWRLSRKAVKGPLTAATGVGALILYFLEFNEIALLLAGGVVVMLGANFHRLGKNLRTLGLLPLAGLGTLPGLSVSFSPSLLFLLFLKIGAVLYGSGYVLLAFLRADFVTRFGWITDQQLMDAIAIGQVTPGPVFTTATFIGYLLDGTSGALLSTLGIFLPSFAFVAISNPIIPRLRRSAWISGLLDGVNVASLGLMAAVTWQLGRSSIVDPLTAAMGLVSVLVLIRFKVNSTWLVLGGACVGLARTLF